MGLAQARPNYIIVRLNIWLFISDPITTTDQVEISVKVQFGSLPENIHKNAVNVLWPWSLSVRRLCMSQYYDCPEMRKFKHHEWVCFVHGDDIFWEMTRKIMQSKNVNFHMWHPGWQCMASKTFNSVCPLYNVLHTFQEILKNFPPSNCFILPTMQATW